MAEGTPAGTVDVDEVMSGLASASLSSPSTLEHPYSMHGRVVIAKVLAMGRQAVGKQVVAGGWVKTGRMQVREDMGPKQESRIPNPSPSLVFNTVLLFMLILVGLCVYIVR
jgi:hypothetical protein